MKWRYQHPERLTGLEKPIFQDNEKIVLYGAGRIGGVVAHCLKQRGVKVAAFCDRAEDKHGTLFCGINVISPEELIRNYSGATVIISSSFYESIRETLLAMGIAKIYDCSSLLIEIDFTDYDFWMEPRYAIRMVEQCLSSLYSAIRNKEAIDTISLTITTRCTLRCAECSSFVPYIARHKDYSASELMQWLNNALGALGSVRVVNFYGGEPFLHPQLCNMLNEMVEERRCEQVQVTTNATILPTDVLISALRRSNAHIRVSQYEGNTKQKIEQLTKIFDENKIQYEVINFTYWDAGAKIKKISEEPSVLRQRFLDCTACRIIYILDGKAFLCSPSCYFYAVNNDCSYNMQYANVDNDIKTVKKSIAALQNRLTTGEYFQFCNFCTGAHCTHSTNKVPVADQEMKLLKFPEL